MEYYPTTSPMFRMTPRVVGAAVLVNFFARCRKGGTPEDIVVANIIEHGCVCDSVTQAQWAEEKERSVLSYISWKPEDVAEEVRISEEAWIRVNLGGRHER